MGQVKNKEIDAKAIKSCNETASTKKHKQKENKYKTANNGYRRRIDKPDDESFWKKEKDGSNTNRQRRWLEDASMRKMNRR